MRTKVIILLATVLALIMTSGSTARAVSEGPLSVKGTLIVNTIGKTVLLRGINYLGYNQVPTPQAHRESTYELFARIGFNVVRLPISWSQLEPSPGRFQESYLKQYVDKDIGWAKKYGLYIILDMHQSNWGEKFGGEGIPAWVINQYPPTEEGMRQAVSDFWTETTLQDHFAKVWMNIARRYANETTVAGYDLLNEPWVFTSINPQLNASHVNNVYLRIIKSIRTVDRTHIVFLEPSNMLPSSFPLKENVVWSPHFYPLAFDPSYRQSDFDILEADITAKYRKFVVEMGSPMWIGEFGAFMSESGSQNWLRDALRAFDKYQLGWAWWAFDSLSGEIPSPLQLAFRRTVSETEAVTLSPESYLWFGVLLEIVIIGLLLALLAEVKLRKKRHVSRRGKVPASKYHRRKNPR